HDVDTDEVDGRLFAEHMCQTSAAAAEIDEGHAVLQAGPTQYLKFDDSNLAIEAADRQAHGLIERLGPQEILDETFIFLDKVMLGHDYPAMWAIIELVRKISLAPYAAKVETPSCETFENERAVAREQIFCTGASRYERCAGRRLYW